MSNKQGCPIPDTQGATKFEPDTQGDIVHPPCLPVERHQNSINQMANGRDSVTIVR